MLSSSQALMWVRGLFTRPNLPNEAQTVNLCHALAKAQDSQCRTVLQPHVPTDRLSYTVVLATERQRWKVSWARSPPGQRTWTLLPVGGAGSPQHLWCGFQAPAPPLNGSIPSLFNGRSCMIRSEVTHALRKKKKTLMCNSLEEV